MQWEWKGKDKGRWQICVSGATVSKEGGGAQDIHNWVVKARGVFIRLRMIWSSKPKSGYTNVEDWLNQSWCMVVRQRMNKSEENRINIFQNRRLRRIPKVSVYLKWLSYIGTALQSDIHTCPCKVYICTENLRIVNFHLFILLLWHIYFYLIYAYVHLLYYPISLSYFVSLVLRNH